MVWGKMSKGSGFFFIPPDEDVNKAFYARAAMRGFEIALERKFWQGLSNLITGSRSQLLSFDEIARQIPFEGQYDGGVQEIEVERIMGSVGRAQDFAAGFLPRSNELRTRWIKIARANLIGEYIPPIEVIQVGSVYFVKDGNHRVSVARVLNQMTISAHVVVIRVPEALTRSTDIETALSDWERELFNNSTCLAVLRPEARVAPSLPGFYRKLLEHIRTHRWLMGEKGEQEVTFEQAVVDWYDSVYSPVVRAIREHHLLAAFPGRSEADLYLWISEYSWYMSEEGSRINYDDAAMGFAEKAAENLPRLLWKVMTRTGK